MQKGRAVANVLATAIPYNDGGWLSGPKIIVSNFQILHHLPDVLARMFPPSLQELVVQLAPFNLEIFQVCR